MMFKLTIVKSSECSLIFDFQYTSWLYPEQLRNVYRKLESDLQTGKNRLEELTEQCDALKKGREESVSSCV